MKHESFSSLQCFHERVYSQFSQCADTLFEMLYQWLAQVSFIHDSWSALLSVQRVEPTDNVQQVAATQIRALLKRRPQHTELPIFVCDAGYDAMQLAQLLGDESIGLLVRLKSNRGFYAEPEERASGGRPRVYPALKKSA